MSSKPPWHIRSGPVARRSLINFVRNPRKGFDGGFEPPYFQCKTWKFARFGTMAAPTSTLTPSVSRRAALLAIVRCTVLWKPARYARGDLLSSDLVHGAHWMR